MVYLVASVCPSFHPSVDTLTPESGSRSKVGQISGAQWLISGAQLCQVQQRAKKSH